MSVFISIRMIKALWGVLFFHISLIRCDILKLSIRTKEDEYLEYKTRGMKTARKAKKTDRKSHLASVERVRYRRTR